MQFILEPKTRGCVFCTLPKQKKDRHNLILFRGKKSFVILNKYPYNNGHLMVVPYKHTSSLEKLHTDTRLEMMELLVISQNILEKKFKAQGFNMGINIGRAGGAGILGHIHFHLLPRWMGDTNFMPVLANNKVMLEYLHDTYDRLAPEFLLKTKKKVRR